MAVQGSVHCIGKQSLMSLRFKKGGIKYHISMGVRAKVLLPSLIKHGGTVSKFAMESEKLVVIYQC